MGGKAKGGDFERSICKQLSLWWTGGERDDIYWRSHSSGARATSRAKKGQSLAGQHGDVCATDPIGQPLIDCFTIEIKRGYSQSSIGDLLDRSKTAAQQRYEEWIGQAYRGHLEEGSCGWMIIAQRNRRDPIVLCSIDLFTEVPQPIPYLTMTCFVRVHKKEPRIKTIVYGTTLKQFLKTDGIKRMIFKNVKLRKT